MERGVLLERWGGVNWRHCDAAAPELSSAAMRHKASPSLLLAALIVSTSFVTNAASARPDRPIPAEPRPAEPGPLDLGVPEEDAGSPVDDAGTPIDSDLGLPETDAGADLDAGETIDSSTPEPDLGLGSLDSGTESPDAFVPATDAGHPDASVPFDAGPIMNIFTTEPSGGACNCDAVGAPSGSPLLLLVMLAILFALRHRGERR